jgi:hypothetical protein
MGLSHVHFELERIPAMPKRLTFVGLIVICLSLAAATAITAQEDETSPVRVDAPDWQFVVYQVQDPYAGTITTPVEPAPDTRYIGIEVAVVNRSDIPLGIALVNVRLRDVSGREYMGGSVFGVDTRLNNRSLGPNERARGWVWFSVSASTEIAQIVFLGPTPEFRLPFSEAPVGEATPATEASPEAE